MKIKNIFGREVGFSPSKYVIDWNGPSPSKLQLEVKKFLRKYWSNHYVCEEMVIPGSRLRVDFINFNKKLVFEPGGKQHNSYSQFMHGSRSGFHASIQRDMKKIKWCEDNGFTVIEIMYNEVNLLSREWIKEKFGIDII